MSDRHFLLVAVPVVLGAALLVALTGAVAEAFRQLRQIRSWMSLDDMPTPLALATVGLPTDAVGLDRIPRTEPDVIAVFLSASCTICRVVADAFQGGSPQRVWFVIEDTAAARHVYSGLAQASRDRVIWDAGRTIATTTGIDITPSLVGIQFGIISRAFGVSSARQVLIMIPTVTPAAHNDATMAERRALRK